MDDFAEDPTGYAITYAGERHRVCRLLDGSEVGVFDTRSEAVAAAEADPTSP